MSILYLGFAGIDFMINLHGCIAVFKKKEEGNLVGAGEDLMVNIWVLVVLRYLPFTFMAFPDPRPLDIGLSEF